jgi:ubiquinone/menaquinone biosynthesis C-methylase UbiE
LRGRYIIDRIKRAVGHRIRLPVPPYGDPNYWEGAYQSFGPDDDAYEWGDVSLSDLLEYPYKTVVTWDNPKMNSQRRGLTAEAESSSSSSFSDTLLKTTTSLAETLGIHPHAATDESILMLGCGNSKLGEEMIEQGWRGPIIQVDVSSRIVETMSLRCATLLQQGDMNFVLDDATELSAFRNDMVHACLDKGLIDALFCAEDFDQCASVLSSVYRVLKPGGCFVCLSFSRPEFVLPKVIPSMTMTTTTTEATATGTTTKSSRIASYYQRHSSRGRTGGSSSSLSVLWETIQVQESNRIMFYRFQKPTMMAATEVENDPRVVSVRKGSRKQSPKQKQHDTAKAASPSSRNSHKA